MQKALDSLVQNQYCVLPDFFTQPEVQSFVSRLRDLQDSGSFQNARIGRAERTQHETKIRSDQICWLDASDTQLSSYFERMELFRLALNEKTFIGANSLESHFAVYKTGAFYKKHRDTFTADDDRVLSTVCYLNESWKHKDGGQLHLYLDGKTKEVEPLSGTLVCFFSQSLEHEVLLTNKERLSIAGWFKKNSLRS